MQKSHDEQMINYEWPNDHFYQPISRPQSGLYFQWHGC